MTNNYNPLKLFINVPSRSVIFVAHVSLILYAFLTLSFGAWAGLESIALPPLKTDEQKLAFLIELKKQVPKLFADAARYNIDLFAMLDDDAALVEQLNKYPEYAEAFATKKYYDITVAPPKEGLLVQESTIKPEALDAWRNKARAALDEFGEHPYENISAQASILVDLGIKENDNIGVILNDLNKILIQNAKAKKPTKSREIDPAVALYNKITLGRDLSLKDRLAGIIRSYEDLSKLSSPIPEKARFEAALKAYEADEKLAVLTELFILLHRIERPSAPLSKNEAQASLRTLSPDDLIFFSDKDALDQAIRTKLSKIIPESLIPRVANNIAKNTNFYAQQRSGEATKVTSTVHLRQVVPVVGIFRGCTGGDCSSQYSFPYPNDPNESVFFILDEKNNTKGYVSATKVLANGAPSLYVITVSGNRVSAGDAELILRGLDTIKEELGIAHIILPEPRNIASLINFPGPRGIYEKYAKGQSLVDINYLLPTIREAIEKYPSAYNKEKYDYMATNKQGILFQPKDQLSKGMEVKLTELTLPAIEPRDLAQVPNEEIFAFMIDLFLSNRPQELSRIQNIDAVQRKIPGKVFYRFVHQTKNCQASAEPALLKTDAFVDALRDLLQSLNIPADFLTSNSHLLWPGIIQCSDAFFEDQIESTAGAIITNYVKKDEQFNFQIHYIIEPNIGKLQKTKKFKELIKELLQQLRGPNPDVKKAALHRFMLIHPTDPEVPLALVEALKDADEIVRILAARALGDIKPRDSAVHVALAEALKDPKWGVREAAAEALDHSKPTEPEVLLALVEALKDPKWDVSFAAAKALRDIKPTDPDVHLALVEALKDRNSDVREAASSVLQHIETADPAVYVAQLKHPDGIVRGKAAAALLNIKPTDLGVHLALVEVLKNENGRTQAGEVLLGINPTDPRVHLALVEALKDRDESVRALAAQILRDLKPNDPKVYRAIARALKAQGVKNRRLAAELLLEIKPTDPKIHLALAKTLLRDPDAETRRYAAFALQMIKISDPYIQRALATALMKDADSSVQAYLVRALQDVQPSDQKVHMVLAKGFSDNQPTVRLNAARVLATIKVNNPKILSALVETLKDLAAHAPQKLMKAQAGELLEQLLRE